MAEDSELPRVPGIRDVSTFYSNFHGEDVAVRPSNAETNPFKIEVLLDGGKATFPPMARVHEGDVVERADPRGGVMEYLIYHYEFSKDPFGHGNDHWTATLKEKGHASRSFAQPQIVVNGGTNQISVGDSNHLQQTNMAPELREVVATLERIRVSTPRDDLSGGQAEELDDALAAVQLAASAGEKSGVVKRSLHGLRGVVEDIAGSAGTGAKDAVKIWAAAATALILSQLSGL